MAKQKHPKGTRPQDITKQHLQAFAAGFSAGYETAWAVAGFEELDDHVSSDGCGVAELGSGTLLLTYHNRVFALSKLKDGLLLEDSVGDPARTTKEFSDEAGVHTIQSVLWELARRLR